MTDWTPLVNAAAPGSAAELQALAGAWTARGALQTGAATAVQGLIEQSRLAWSGSPGSQSFRGSLRVVVAAASDAAAAASTAAGALATYARVLGDAHERADAFAAAGTAAQIAAERLALARVDPLVPPPPGDPKAEVEKAMLNLGELRLEVTYAATISSAAIQTALAALRRANASTRSLVTPGAVDPTLHDSGHYRQWLGDWVVSHGPDHIAGPTTFAHWSALTPGEQQALIAAYPDAVGNTSGVDPKIRNAANRAAMNRDADQIIKQINDHGLHWQAVLDPASIPNKNILTQMLTQSGFAGTELVRARDVLAAKYQVAKMEQDSQGPATVLVYKPGAYDGKGRIAVALGDVTTADNVSVIVPGMTSDVPNYLDNEAAMAISHLRTCREMGPGTVAVVAYIGYDAPGVDLSAADMGKAEEGAQWVATDFNDIAAMRAAPGPGHLTGIFHSYGSVLAGYMAKHLAPKIDDYVLMGSPGAGDAQSAADMQKADHVFVLASSADPVTTLAQQEMDPAQRDALNSVLATQTLGPQVGGIVRLLSPLAGRIVDPDLGRDPAGAKFGAIRLQAENVGPKSQFDADNHQYLKPHTESAQAAAAVVMGRRDLMRAAPARQEPGDHFAGSDPEFARPGETR